MPKTNILIPLKLPRFAAAVNRFSDSLTTGTSWRYQNGYLPSFGLWLVENPDVAEALAADARELAAQHVMETQPREQAA